MLDRPRKRICPSLMRAARSKMLRHDDGLKKGSRPSATSINEPAPSSKSQKLASAKRYFRSRLTAGALAAVASAAPRIAAKKSLPGSTTIRSVLLRKLDR